MIRKAIVVLFVYIKGCQGKILTNPEDTRFSVLTAVLMEI
jgi:hypothetical protein